ncbi:MAG: cache domain-containing protein [Geobacter sp.]|nr:cache domain-containing protein [Geobacter sp.]
MRLRPSIRTKLLFSFLLILFIPYAILLYSTIRNVNASLEKEIDKELEMNLRYALDQYWVRANQSRIALMQPAGSPFVQQAVIHRDETFLGDALQRWEQNLPFLDFLIISDSNREVLTRTGGTGTRECLRLYHLFDEAKRTGKPVISAELVSNSLLSPEKPIISAGTGESMVVVAVVPIITKERKFLGCIIAGDIINRDPHVPFRVRQIFGKEGEVTITQRGTRIASSLADERTIPATLPKEVLSSLERGVPYRGEARIGGRAFKTAFEPIKNFKGEFVGSLAVVLSKENFKNIQVDSLKNIEISAIVGILLSFCMAYVASRRLADPLRKLRHASEQIEQGHLTQHVKISGSEEYEMLASAFNKMADTLEERDATIMKKALDLEDVNLRLHELNEELEKRVEERTAELLVQKGRLEAILSSMAEAVVVTDRENRIILFNPAARKIFDTLSTQVEGSHIEQICEVGGFCRLVEYLRELRKDAETTLPRAEEMEVRGKKLKVNISPLFDEQQDFAGAVMSIRDVTAEEEIDRMKTEFISTVSHELKTPLTSIKGALQLIMQRGESLNDTERELLRICERNTDRLIRLISDILDISKIEAGRMEFSFKPHSMFEMVAYSAEELGAFAASRRISIHNEISKDLPPVRADHDRIIQVINNLLANAVKFSPEGETVTISAEREGSMIAVAVADRGKTIQPAERDKLFRKFEKISRADHLDRGGTGLGLAISREIVERHQGRIHYRAGNGQGNAFVFTLPANEEEKS